MRGYAENVEVTTADTGEASAPETFVWRGRRYRVAGVLESWREATPWWRLPMGEQGVYDAERRVWRVEASAGASPSLGVFDLAHARSGWSLERLSD